MTANLLDYNECKEILKNAQSPNSTKVCELKNFHIEPATEASGFLGEYYHLFLNYDNNIAIYDNNANECRQRLPQNINAGEETLKLFIKALPKHSTEAEKEKIFKKEARLYESILKDLRKYCTNICRCFYSREDLFVLENLNNSGYQICPNQNENLSKNELLSILQALANLHAASIVFEVTNNAKMNEYFAAELFEEITLKPNISWFSVGLNALMAIIRTRPKYKTPDMQLFVKNDFEKHLLSICNMQETSLKYRNVVCHRDAWRGNIFFEINNNNSRHNEVPSCILIDFQTCRYCPPAIDLVFALFMNTSTAERQSMENFYLNTYYEYLKLNLSHFNIEIENQFSFDELLMSYNEFKLFGSVYRAISETLFRVPRDFITNQYKHLDRTDKVLEYMTYNEEFCALMEKCVDEILEYLL